MGHPPGFQQANARHKPGVLLRSILVRIELVGSRHRNANRCERVQDVDGVAVRGEHLGEALVAVRLLVQTSAAKDNLSVSIYYHRSVYA